MILEFTGIRSPLIAKKSISANSGLLKAILPRSSAARESSRPEANLSVASNLDASGGFESADVSMGIGELALEYPLIGLSLLGLS
jgi:hypothetical protein